MVDLASRSSSGPAFTAATYFGHASSMAWGLTAVFAAIHTAIAITDQEQTGITRANSDFTFAAAGTYEVRGGANIANGTTGKQLALRMRDAGVDLVAGSTFVNASTIGHCAMAGILTVTAGQVLQLQYLTGSGGTMGALGGNTVDGSLMRHFFLLMRRIA